MGIASRICMLMILLSCLMPGNSSAQNIRKYSNEFLHIGTGARGLAMGRTLSVLSDDSWSVFWNPANTLMIKGNRQLGLTHSSYFAGIGNYNAGVLSFRQADRRSASSLAFIRLAVDDIPNTLELIGPDGSIRYDLLKSFSAIDQAFFFSHSRQLKTAGMSMGGNIKIIRRTAGDFASAWGFGFDLAWRYHWGYWGLALVARDLSTTFNAWTFNTALLAQTYLITGNEIPESSTEITMPSATLGLARTIRFSDNAALAMELDIELSSDGKRNVLLPGDPISLQPSAGFELRLAEVFRVRGGIGGFQRESKASGDQYLSFLPSLGAGIVIQELLSIDYAFTDPGNQSIALYSHIISLNINISRREGSNGTN
jgi:hypothetical protein